MPFILIACPLFWYYWAVCMREQFTSACPGVIFYLFFPFLVFIFFLYYTTSISLSLPIRRLYCLLIIFAMLSVSYCVILQSCHKTKPEDGTHEGIPESNRAARGWHSGRAGTSHYHRITESSKLELIPSSTRTIKFNSEVNSPYGDWTNSLVSLVPGSTNGASLGLWGFCSLYLILYVPVCCVDLDNTQPREHLPYGHPLGCHIWQGEVIPVSTVCCAPLVSVIKSPASSQLWSP